MSTKATSFIRKYKQATWLVLLIIFSTAMAYGQESPGHYLKKYRGEYAVRLQDHCYTDIKVSKGELDIERHYIQKSVYLDKGVSGLGNISLKYMPPFTSIEEMDAFTLVPTSDGDKYEKEKVRDFFDKEVMSDDIFYGGNRAKIFSYPRLQKGAITVLEYTEKIHEPKLIGSEVFQGFLTTEDQLLELKYDEEVNIDIKYFNCSEEDFIHTIDKKSGQIIHRWVPTTFKKIKDETEMPEYLSVVPHIVYRINSFQYKGETIPVLRNPSDLHNWYKSLMTEVYADQDEHIAQLTDSIISGVITQEEKTEKIFKWVQGNIKYIAFEDGLGGFKPRLPSEVFNKRYGDCKDMSCLVVNMLQHAGIPAYHTWIGTRSIPYSYSEVPSPLADNHMIVAARVNDEMIFLDPTNSDLPFPLPSSFIQGKEALIGLSPDSFTIRKVPVVSSGQNVSYDSAFFQIQGTTLKGSGKRNYAGYYADNINRNLNNNDQKHLNDMLRQHVRKGNNKCNSGSYHIDRRNDRTMVQYDFDVPDYAYADEGKIFINLNLEKVMDDFKIKDDREHPVEYRFAYKVVRKYTLEIPEGYQVSYMPEPAEKTFDDFGYQLSYQVKENKLHYNLEIDLRTLRIEKEDFEDWNNFIKDLNRSYNETIILSKA